MPYCNALFYRRYDGGAGVSSHPTILLHGLGGSHLSWPVDFRRLPKHTVYALDLPGHGQSNNGTCVDMDCYMEAMREFLNSMRFERVNLVGHSMGAMVSFAFASQFPNKVQSLALLSIGEVYPFARQLELGFIREKTRAQTLRVFESEGFYPAYPKSMRRKLLAPLQTARLSLLHADAMVCANFDPRKYRREMPFPVLIISGRDDKLVPLSSTRSFAAQIRQAQQIVIDECGHFLLYEKPEAVSSYLLRFLDKNG